MDKETGVVWEKSPDTTVREWIAALAYSINNNVGGRKGWCLQFVEELASLIDPNAALAPFLPTGHPFTSVQWTGYWSAAAFSGTSTHAWGVFRSGGGVGDDPKTGTNYAWCVRGNGPLSEY